MIKNGSQKKGLVSYIFALREKCPKWGFSCSVFSCIQSEYRKIRITKNSVFGYFSRTVSEDIEMLHLKKTSCQILLFENWNMCMLLVPNLPVSSSKIWYVPWHTLKINDQN